MRVDQHHRLPFADRRDLAARFRLGQSEPVAIQIEQIMVEAPAGPLLVVLGSGRIGNRHGAARLGIMLYEAIAPVRVLRRIDHDEGVREDGFDPRIAPCGEQVIGQSERGIAARDFVTMHAVGKPRHRH